MRERLIELLRNAPRTNVVYGNIKLDKPAQTLQTIADHLLANGVIVLPCKVGDVIYYLDRYSNSIQTDTVKFFTVTKNGCKPILERHNKKFWEMYEWGKTVFLSKEEAEKALRGDNNAE